MSKSFKKFFNLLILLVFGIALASCTTLSEEEKDARDLARVQLNEVLDRITWAEPESTIGNVFIAEADTKPVDEEYNQGIKSGLIYGAYAKFESSNSSVMDIEWVAIQKRVEVKNASDEVVGLERATTYELRGIVERPEVGEDAVDVTLNVVASIDYSFNLDGAVKTKTITLTKEIVFTVLPKVPSVAKTIGEIEAYAQNDFATFVTNGMEDGQGNKNTAVTVNGYVSHILYGANNGSFMLTDELGDSMYVFNSGNNDIQIGNYVSVNGVPAGYYNAIQIGAGSTVTILDDATDHVFNFAEVDIDQWHDEKDLSVDHTLGGTLISIRGLVVSESGAFRIVSEQDASNYFLVYASSYGAYEKAILQSYVGKVVQIKGTVYDYHSGGYWRMAVNCFEYPIVELVLSDAEKIAADKSSIVQTMELFAGDSFTLPTGTLSNGSLLGEWQVSVEGVLDLATLKALDVTDETVVTLTNTLTLNGLTESVSIEVTVKPQILKISIAEFLEKPENDTDYYIISGVITRWYRTGNANDPLYGNIYISDGTAEVLIYGVLLTKGGESKQFEQLGLGLGDAITVCGIRSSYSGPQMPNAYHVDSAKATTIAEFLEKTTEDKTYYALTGVVANIANTTYGNLTIEDGENSLYVYGLLGEKGGPNKVFSTLNVKVGNTITIVAQYGYYSPNAQAANAYLVANAAPLNDEALLALDIATLPATLSVNVGDTLVLPSGLLANGSEIGAWTADPVGLFDGDMVALEVSVDTVVNFTATVTNGEAFEEVTIAVTIKADIVDPGSYALVKEVDFGTANNTGYAAGKVLANFPGIVFHWAQPVPGPAGLGTDSVAVICPLRKGNATADSGLFFTLDETVNKISFDMAWWSAADSNNVNRIVSITVEYKVGNDWVNAGTVDKNTLSDSSWTNFEFFGFSATEVRIYIVGDTPNLTKEIGARILADNIKFYKNA